MRRKPRGKSDNQKISSKSGNTVKEGKGEQVAKNKGSRFSAH